MPRRRSGEILGTTGEAPGLACDLRRQLVERTCALVAGRVPVLVGISDTSFAETLRLAHVSADKGASALVLAPPYYYPNSQAEILEYLEHLTPQLPLPLFLYNMPSHTKTHLNIDTVRRALDMPHVVGVKDSSGDMVNFHRLVRLMEGRTDRSLLMGPEELLGESVLFGGHGGVCGGANLCPRLYVDLYQAAQQGDLEKVTQLHKAVMALSETIYKVGIHSSSFIKGLKCALSLLDICDDFMIEPFHRFREKEREMVRSHLAGFSISKDHPYPS